MQQGPRVAVIGLDCGTPQLLFDDLAADVPNISKLMAEGMYGDLASITPPITVPAWACAMTGKTPGELGIYGFRNRKDTSYEGLSIAHSGSIGSPAVWDTLGEQGKSSLLIGVPPGFPPPKEFPGWRVGCFLTPPSADHYAYPQELEMEIEEELGGKGQYIFDIPNFRQQGMDFVLDQVFKMTERRFKVARRLVKREAVGLLHDGGDGDGPAPPRLLALLRPEAPALQAREPLRGRVPAVLPGARRRGRHAAGAPPGGRDHDRDERPRRPRHDGRDLLQRLADRERLSRPEGAGHRAHADREDRDRLGPHDGLGRRRVLRPALPERRGSRAPGHDPAGRLRDRARRARDEARGDAGTRRGAVGNEGPQAAGRLPGGARRGPGPPRLLRRSRVAFGGLGRQPERVHASRTTSDPTARTTTGPASSR